MRNLIIIAFHSFLSIFLHNIIVAQSENEIHFGDNCFDVFWIEFREIVLNDDSTKLMELIHFPLQVRGEQDEDTVLCLSKDNFYSYFKKFLLNSSFFINGRYITNIECIRNTIIPEKATLFQETVSWKRVGDLEFEKVKNKWGLSLLYYPR